MERTNFCSALQRRKNRERKERLEFVVKREGNIIEYLQRHHSGVILRIPIMRIERVTSGLEGVVLKESSAGFDGCPITNSYYICKEKKVKEEKKEQENNKRKKEI